MGITVVFAATGDPSSTTGAEGVASTHEVTTTEVVAPPTVTAQTTGTATETNSSRTTTLTVPGGDDLVLALSHGNVQQVEVALVIPTDRPLDVLDDPALPLAPRLHDDATLAPKDPSPKMARVGVRLARTRRLPRNRRSLEGALQRKVLVNGKA